jgi:hypothetical protein
MPVNCHHFPRAAVSSLLGCILCCQRIVGQVIVSRRQLNPYLDRTYTGWNRRVSTVGSA